MGKLYTVAEQFYSFQGEGEHSGKAAYFVRMYGCDVQCTWCDSGFTWKKELRPTSLEHLTANEIVRSIESNSPANAFVVLTGGEPCLYDLEPLIQQIHNHGRSVHLETAGHKKIPRNVDWVTLSPKPQFGAIPSLYALQRADELKFVIHRKEDIRNVEIWTPHSNAQSVWLNPEDSMRTHQTLLDEMVAFVKEHGGRYRVGWQTHKTYNVR